MNIQLERIHRHLTRLGKILHEYPDTSDQWEDTEQEREWKEFFRIGTQRAREDFGLDLNPILKDLDERFGEVEDD